MHRIFGIKPNATVVGENRKNHGANEFDFVLVDIDVVVTKEGVELSKFNLGFSEDVSNMQAVGSVSLEGHSENLNRVGGFDGVVADFETSEVASGSQISIREEAR